MKLIVSIIMMFAFYAQAEISEEPIIDPELQAELNEETVAKRVRLRSKKVNNERPQGLQPLDQYQAQPVTQVTASPLQESRAEQIRRLRQDAEIKTEQKIVEKLEASRLEDEKLRSQRLFGDRLATQPQPEPQVAAVYTAPVQNEAPAANEEQDLEDVKNEIAQEVRAQLEAEKSTRTSRSGNKSYVGALVGMGEYPGLVDVQTDYSTGVAIGTEVMDHLIVEGSFMYSIHNVEKGYPFFDEMDQYNVALALKYKMLQGPFSPIAGGLVSYTSRRYSAKAVDFYSNESVDLPLEDQDTQSVDFGIIIGADLKVSKSFQIGADYRHYFNLTSRNNDTPYFVDQIGNNRLNVEGEEYWFFNVSAKMTF